MMKGIDFYKSGWKDCLELMETMNKSDGYESWQQMIDELKERFKERAQ